MNNHDNNYDNITVPENTEKLLMDSMDMAVRRKKQIKRRRTVSCLAAALAVVIAVPNLSPTAARAMESVPVLGNLFSILTVRDYQDESDRYNADVKIPYISASDEISQEEADKINAEIEATCTRLIDEYETNKKELAGEGYEDLVIKSEIASDSKDFFTLKLILYTGAGSGYQQDDYYTIDKKTGKQVLLGDILSGNYIETINREIIRQMKEQMDSDSSAVYFIGPEMDGFVSISSDQDFYFDKDGNIVICFDEYEVAPGSMGCVSFTIDINMLDMNIRK